MIVNFAEARILKNINYGELMKTFEIHSEVDFDKMVKKFVTYFIERKRAGHKFQSLNIVSKKWRKPKTSRAHRKYWATINELKKAFKESGNIVNEKILHEFIKRESGYTKVIEMPNGQMVMVSKSISDNSEDINSGEMAFLIDFTIRWAQEHLNYVIQDKG